MTFSSVAKILTHVRDLESYSSILIVGKVGCVFVRVCFCNFLLLYMTKGKGVASISCIFPKLFSQEASI